MSVDRHQAFAEVFAIIPQEASLALSVLAIRFMT